MVLANIPCAMWQRTNLPSNVVIGHHHFKGTRKEIDRISLSDNAPLSPCYVAMGHPSPPSDIERNDGEPNKSK